MENQDPKQNLNVPQEQPQEVSTPQAQTPQAAASQPQPTNASGVNKTLLFLVFSVLALFVLITLYFFALKLSNQTKDVSRITPVPKTSPSPTSAVAESTSEEDVNTIDLGNPDEDIKSINSDLESL